MDAYTERNCILAELGYKDYRAYLRSQLWKDIRARKLAQDQSCYGCGREQFLQVHHSEYSLQNLTGTTLDGLWSVCARCHRWCEVTKSGQKRNPDQATKELFRIRKLYDSRRNVKMDSRTVFISRDVSRRMR